MNSFRLSTLAALLAAFALNFAAQAQEPLPCKNHYILRCGVDDPGVVWTALPDSLFAHYPGHTATELADGRILVVGGGRYVFDPRTQTSSIRDAFGAELLDPVAGTWEPTAPMNRMRMGHHAVLLLDGRVLVIGGDEQGRPGDYQGTAEVFDPATGIWSPTAGPATPRAGSTATPLPDGRVLLVGGVDRYDNTIPDAEVYDPRTGAWQPTRGLAEPRLAHTATVLPDGRVLVVGGMTDDFFMYPTGSAEVFDPATDKWSDAGSIDARWMHSATLTEEGTVVVAGGYISVPSRSGWYQASDVASTAIYDPSKGTWSRAGDLNSLRHRHLAARLRGHGVLLFGGKTPTAPIPRYTEGVVERAEFLPLGGEQWQEAISASALSVSSTHYHSATGLADGSILFLGDLDGARALLLRPAGKDR